MGSSVLRLLKTLAVAGLLYVLTASLTILGAKSVSIGIPMPSQLPSLWGACVAVSYLLYVFYTSESRPQTNTA